jgi:hypothetical protein
MTLKQIADTYGLPARIRIPLEKHIVNQFGKSVRLIEFLHRTITKKLENGHYLQYDESQPWHGEFQCCYVESVSDKVQKNWEYAGKPTPEQLPEKGKENGWDKSKNVDPGSSSNS